MHKILFAVVFSLVFSSAYASSESGANTAPAPTKSGAAYDVGLVVGTLGGGVQLGYVISPNKFNVRLNYAQYDYSQTTTSDGASYTGTLKLQTTGLFGDWHPFTGTFRLTGGVLYNNNSMTLVGQPSGGSYTFNNVTYTGAQVGSVTASVTFDKYSPYLGIGFGDGSDTQGFHFTSDIGVMQEKPTATITATGAASNPALASNIAAAQAKMQSDLSVLNLWPVIQVGVNYRF